jgi:hypothetical protein
VTVDIQPWAIGAGADVIDQPTFLALFAPGGIGLNGFATGEAISGQLNKVWRQSSFVAAALATAVSATLGQDVLDNGNLPALTAQIVAAISALVESDPSSFKTGDTKWRPTADTQAGWVRMNALSIGDATSAASERANADTLNLYALLWNNFAQAQCPVTGGRGASAAADFAAHKPIQLLDMRGTAPFGLDGMGNSLAGRLASGTPNVGGSGGGDETNAIAQANLPNVSIGVSGSTNSAGAHVHTFSHSVYGPDSTGSSGTTTVTAGGATPLYFFNPAGGQMFATTAGAHTHTVSGATAALGSGVALYTMPPYMLGAWYLKL